MNKKKEMEQLNMNLKEPFKNRLTNIKYKVELFFVKLRTNTLFTAPFLWISSALVFSFVLTQNHYYYKFIDILPKEIPLFLLAKNPDLRIVEKDSLLGVLILSILLTIISIVISVKTYYRFKLVSIFIMTNLVLSIFLITISYIKIFAMYIF